MNLAFPAKAAPVEYGSRPRLQQMENFPPRGRPLTSGPPAGKSGFFLKTRAGLNFEKGADRVLVAAEASSLGWLLEKSEEPPGWDYVKRGGGLLEAARRGWGRAGGARSGWGTRWGTR